MLLFVICMYCLTFLGVEKQLYIYISICMMDLCHQMLLFLFFIFTLNAHPWWIDGKRIKKIELSPPVNMLYLSSVPARQ